MTRDSSVRSGADLFEIRFESIGGLGAHVAGKIVAGAAVLRMNMNGSHFSSYGSEKKGSVVRSFIRLAPADRSIRTSAPIEEPDVIVVFHGGLLAHPATLSGLKADGTLIYAGQEGELPEVLERRIWNKPILGLLITTGLTLVAANWLDLNSIATIGSAGFLLIFSAVNVANVILSKQTGSLGWISGFGALACLVALFALLWQIEMEAPLKILVLVAIALAPIVQMWQIILAAAFVLLFVLTLWMDREDLGRFWA